MPEDDTIMSHQKQPIYRVREFRERNGWSQAELAEQAGISRTAVSAIEGERLTPSVAAALALAASFGCSVEELFGRRGKTTAPRWAWPRDHSPGRCWLAEHQGEFLAYAPSDLPASFWPHDAATPAESLSATTQDLARRTLVIATCDPAVGLLAHELWDSSGIRLLAVPRSSRQALQALQAGLVHVAGIHLASAHASDNSSAAREILQQDFQLLSMGTWQSGVALSSTTGPKSLRSLSSSRLSWIGREKGSGAYQCLQQVLGDRLPKRMARDHRGVADAIRNGWGDAGISLQWVAEEYGLGFLDVRRERYDLCIPHSMRQDPRIAALLRTVRSSAYHHALQGLAGVETHTAGELQSALSSDRQSH